MTNISPKAKRLRLAATQEQHLSFPIAEAEDDRTASDIINFFAKRGGRASDLERENARLQAEINRLDSLSKAAQQETAALKERLRVQAQDAELHQRIHEEDRADAEKEYEREVVKSANALEKLNDAQKSQAAADERAEKAESQLAEIRIGFRQEALTVQARIQQLESELRAAELAARMAEGRRRSSETAMPLADLRDLQSRNQALEADLASARQLQGKLEVALAEQTKEMQRLASALHKIQGSGSSSDLDVIKALRSELRSQEAEIAEARKVKGRIKNMAIMQEKLYRAEAATSRAEKVQSNEAKLQDTISKLELQLQAWEGNAADLGVDDPAGLGEKLRELLNQYLNSQEELQRKEAGASQLREKLQEATTKNSKAEAEQVRLQGLLSQAQASSDRHERQVQLLTQQQKGMERLLASLSKEDAMSPSPGRVQEAVDRELLVRQQALLDTLTLQNQRLESDVSEAAKDLSQTQGQLAAALTKVAQLEADKSEAQRELDSWEEKANQLQSRLDKGEFNPMTTRVLHFVANPEAEARREAQSERLLQLEAELAAYKLQLSRMGASQNPEPPETANSALAVVEAKAVIAEQKVAELTKREARLKDVFQKQVANFREAVYSLFGYRVDIASEAQVKDATHKGDTTFVLRPQFADSSRMQLMFRFHKGQMELLPTEFTERKLKREVETFIERFNCIPAFTANWTMELFQKQAHA